MTKRLFIKTGWLCCCLWVSGFAWAQQEGDASPRLLHNAVMLGVGSNYVYDTYLSPLEYSGFGRMKVYGEWMRAVGKPSKKLSVRHSFDAHFSKTKNPLGNASFLSGGLYYNLAYHRRFTPLPRLTLLAGGSFSPDLGMVYSTRNGNNPVNANVSVNLNLSAMALYQLNIRSYSVHLRAQIDVPTVGVLFSPHFGQSYYEIWALKDYEGLVHFASFHNQRACRMLITADFPVGNVTIRGGYSGDFYRREVSNLSAYSVGHTFMIGLARDILSFSGKRIKQLTKPSSFYLWEE